MIYSYTQLSHYLACPRKYRYRYLDGWQEKETRAGMLFGRAFEQALAAYFHRQDATEVLFREWSQYQHTTLDYSRGGQLGPDAAARHKTSRAVCPAGPG
jgi:hypothetical protein